MSELSKVRPYSITFSVVHLESTAGWYIQKLGFQKVQQKSYPEFKTSLIFLEQNGYQVELIKDNSAKGGMDKHPIPPAHTSVLGQSQFCFITENLNGIKRQRS